VVDNPASCRYPVIFFVVALVLLFYVHLNSCASYVESWVGMLAPQVSSIRPDQLCSCRPVHIQVQAAATSYTFVQVCGCVHLQIVMTVTSILGCFNYTVRDMCMHRECVKFVAYTMA
jgi:hypothetical protein